MGTRPVDSAGPWRKLCVQEKVKRKSGDAIIAPSSRKWRGKRVNPSFGASESLTVTLGFETRVHKTRTEENNR
jgi:hypothetical protein